MAKSKDEILFLQGFLVTDFMPLVHTPALVDNDGFCDTSLWKLIAYPECNRRRRESHNPHPYYKRPGKGHNHDYCDNCREGGDLLCCDVCPQSFHLECHYPPIDNIADIPGGRWLCMRCENKSKPDVNWRTAKLTMVRKLSTNSGAGPSGSNDRQQRALLREARKSTASASASASATCDNDEEQDNTSEEINNTFDSLVKQGVYSNPLNFDLPQSLSVKVTFPGDDKVTTRSSRKNAAPKKKVVEEKKNTRPARNFCKVCYKGLTKKSIMVSCDYCDSSYHLDCLDGPLTVAPQTMWMCPLHSASMVDQKLWRGGLTERMKLYTEHVYQPVNEHHVKVDFLRKSSRMRYIPYSKNRSLPPANTAQVPSNVVEAYRNPLPKAPSDVDIEQSILLKYREYQLQFQNLQVPEQNKPPVTVEEKELLLDSVNRLSVETAKVALGLQKWRTRQVEVAETAGSGAGGDVSESESGSEDGAQAEALGPYIEEDKLMNGTDVTSLANGTISIDECHSYVNRDGVGGKLSKAVKNTILDDDAIEHEKKMVSTLADLHSLLTVVEKEFKEENKTEVLRNPAGGDYCVNEERPAKRRKVEVAFNTETDIPKEFDRKTVQDYLRLKELLDAMPEGSRDLLALKQLSLMEKESRAAQVDARKPLAIEHPSTSTSMITSAQAIENSEHTKLSEDSDQDDDSSNTPEVKEFELSIEMFRPMPLPDIEELQPYDGPFYGHLTLISKYKLDDQVPLPIVVTKSVFWIGTGEANHLRLTNFGNCRYLSGYHGSIQTCRFTHKVTYVDESQFGTIVDSVLYCRTQSTDVEAKEQTSSKLQNHNEEIRQLRSQRKRVMEPPKAVYSSPNKIEDGNSSSSENGATNEVLNGKPICSCTGPPRIVQAFNNSANLREGSTLQFGCMKFKFSLNRKVLRWNLPSGAELLLTPLPPTAKSVSQSSTCIDQN